MGLSAFNSYVSALQAATQAYDRTLLSPARTVSERLVVLATAARRCNVPWVVLDSFELNMNDRLYYKVVDPDGRTISGYDDLPNMPPSTSRTSHYPALAWFIIPSIAGGRSAWRSFSSRLTRTVCSAWRKSTSPKRCSPRRYLATQLLFSSLVSQGLLVLLTLVLTARGCCVALRPMRQLSSLMVRREPGLLAPLPELLPRSENAAADCGI